MKLTLTLMLILLSLALIAFGYVLFVRPWLEGKGWVKPLPDDARTWRDRIAAHVWGSVTVAWAWLLGMIGTALTAAPYLGDWFNQPDIKTQLQGMLTPGVFGISVVVIGVLTFIARLRSLLKGS